jgi:hypothetical protein
VAEAARVVRKNSRHAGIPALSAGCVLPVCAAVLGGVTHAQELDAKLSKVVVGIFYEKGYQELGTRVPDPRFKGIERETTGVLACFGERFGLTGILEAGRGERLRLATIWRFPPQDRPDASGPVTEAREEFVVRNHETVRIWYTLAHKHDIVRGSWSMQVFLSGIEGEKQTGEDGRPRYWIPLYETTFQLGGAPDDCRHKEIIHATEPTQVQGARP